MTKHELIARLRDLELAFTKRVFDLEQHQAELKAQQADLVDSQRQLEESRDRYADLYDFAPVGFVSFDPNGVVREINLTAAHLLGTERARLVGIPFVTFVTGRDRRVFLDHLWHCRRDGLGTVVRMDVLLRTPGGGEIPVELQSHRAGSREIINTALIDLTERQRLEHERLRGEQERERILQSEKAAREASDAKDRFLAMLSHELRAPLASIGFALGAIREHAGVPAEIVNAVEMIGRNVALEARLIDELLDVTRIQRGKLSVQLEVVTCTRCSTR
jgi:PAS domain S-box-containing protein